MLEDLRRKIELYNIHPLAKRFKDKLIYMTRIRQDYVQLYDYKFVVFFYLDSGYCYKECR